MRPIKLAKSMRTLNEQAVEAVSKVHSEFGKRASAVQRDAAESEKSDRKSASTLSLIGT